MKRINSLLALFCIILCPLLQSCKKDKAEKAEDPPPAPMAAYDFDNDWLKNSMSPLLNGAAVGNLSSTTDSFNTPYAALQFSGDGYVKVKDSDLLDFVGNQFTITAWIRPVETQAAYIIIKSEDANHNSPYSLDIFPGVVRAFIRTNTKEQFLIEGKSPIIKGVWQHIAVTFTGEQLTIYYNGKNEGSVMVDRPLSISSGDLAIGASEEYFPSVSFVGRIDNVRIYDKGLTTAQIKNIYQNYKQ